VRSLLHAPRAISRERPQGTAATARKLRNEAIFELIPIESKGWRTASSGPAQSARAGAGLRTGPDGGGGGELRNEAILGIDLL
jgi:hypothetical protein